MSLNVDNAAKAQTAPSETQPSDPSANAANRQASATLGNPATPTVQSLAHSGTSGADSAAVGQFLSDHPEQKQSLQNAAFTAGNYTLFHQLSQPPGTSTAAANDPAVAGPQAAATKAVAADNSTPTPQPTPQPGQYTTLSSKAREAGFWLRHPSIANDIGQVEHNSTNISTDAERFATVGPKNTSGSVLNESPSHEGSQVNAFRHALWQATIASKYGNSIAAQVGNAHEDNPLVDLNQRTFPSVAAADQTIDLNNNVIGRAIAAQNPGASTKDLAGKVLETFHNDGLYTVSGTNADGSVNIARTKISDAQYNTMKGLLAQTDPNGFIK